MVCKDKTPISEALFLNTIRLFIDKINDGISNRINNLERRMDIAMAKLSDVQAKQAEAIAAVQRAVARVVEDNEAQNTEIQRLKDLIAAGTPVTEADLDGLVSSNQSIIDTMNALDPIPPTIP